MAVTASKFIQYLEASGLLEASDLSAARSYANQFQADGQALAVHLVQVRKLTPYQAKQLLAGNTRGFFLEKYKILEPIGRGGMGLVFKAEHTMLGRLAAIKVLPRKAASDREAVERFGREARAAAKLEHENIVRVYDVGQQGSAHFIAMELVQGLSLSRTVKSRGRLPAHEAVSLICQVAEGLDHAFSRGITHRDVKPSNILVTPEGKAKILDMGLARVFGLTAEEGANQLSLTMSGTVVGTVDYVAPEQADDSHKADVRSDIYSLGCTLYECITGRVPFPGGTMMQKLMRHYKADPTEISELAPGTPEGLIAVVKRMMAKRASDRFQRPSEVARALLPFLSGVEQSAASNVVIPLAARQADPFNSVAAVPDASASAPRDLDNAGDVSQPTMPTIPLGTTTPSEQTTKLTRRSGDLGPEQINVPHETVKARVAPSETKKEFSDPSSGAPPGPPMPASNPNISATSPVSVSPRAPAPTTRPVQPKLDKPKVDDALGVNEVLDAIALAASESPPSAVADPMPRFSWTRTHTFVSAAAAAIVVIAIGIAYWVGSRPGILVLQFPEEFAEAGFSDVSRSGRVLLDGRPLENRNQLRQEFPVKTGQHRLVVEVPGLTPVSRIILIERAEPVVVELTPTTEQFRKWELAKLRKRVGDETNKEPSNESVVQLQNDLRAFSDMHRGSEESLDALALRSRLPWPADRLQEIKSSRRLLSVASKSSALQAMLVGVADSPPVAQSAVTCLAFSPDGRYLSCGRTNGKVDVWDLNGTQSFRNLGDHHDAVLLTAFDADSKSLTSVSASKIAFWDLASGAEQSKIEGMKSQLTAAAHSSDGRTLACAFQEGFVSIYDVAARREKTQIGGFTSPGQAMALSSTGTALAFGSKENVEIWDASNARLKGNVRNSPDTIVLSLSEDDQWLSMVDREGTARVWRIGAVQFSVTLEHNCSFLAFSPLVRIVVAVTDGRTIQVILTKTGEQLGTIEMNPSVGSVPQLAFSPDGRHLAIANSSGTVYIVRIEGAEFAPAVKSR